MDLWVKLSFPIGRKEEGREAVSRIQMPLPSHTSLAALLKGQQPCYRTLVLLSNKTICPTTGHFWGDNVEQQLLPLMLTPAESLGSELESHLGIQVVRGMSECFRIYS
jgi:hypothetical protein